MENVLHIALVQSPLVWEDAAANRLYFSEKIAVIQQEIDLIVLPEMFSTGFTMSPENCYETMSGKTVKWMQETASEKNCAITGSLVIKERGSYRNRLLFVFPDGSFQYYDKWHLFSLAGEDKIYKAGKNRLEIEYKGFRICPLVCYDLRFPAFARNTTDYDLLLYVANWPKPRIAAWNALLKARAIENMCYVMGVNRVGEDQKGNDYPGHSQALDHMGEFVVSAWENEGVFVATIEKEAMLEARKRFGFLADRDNVTVS